MKTQELFIKLKERMKAKSKKGDRHDWGHIERVLRNATHIAKVEKADLEIVKFAALLHDIKRHDEDLGKIKCHAEEGAKEAMKILKHEKFPEQKIPFIGYAIENHRLSKNTNPKTKEARIIQDADRLDSLGAILIARAFSSAHIHKRPFYDENGRDNVITFIQERSKKLNPKNFNTRTGKKMAKERYDYSQHFTDRMLKEIKGEI